MMRFVKGRWYDAVVLSKAVGRDVVPSPCPVCSRPTKVFAKLTDTVNQYRAECSHCGYRKDHKEYVNQ